MKQGTLLPNAGVDASKRPAGLASPPLPADPNGSALRIRNEIEGRYGIKIGVLVIDSRTHAMRLGCSGGRYRLGSGITSVIDDRGTKRPVRAQAGSNKTGDRG